MAKVPLRWKHSIFAELLTVVFSIYFAVAGSVTFAHMFAEYFRTKNEILQDLKVMQKTFNDVLANSLWLVDEARLRATLQGMLEIPFIAGVKIISDIGTEYGVGTISDEMGRSVQLDANGKALLLDESISLNQVFGHSFPLVYHDPELGDNRVGQAIIYSSQSVVWHKVKYGFVFILINSVIKTLALSIIFIWAGQRWLGRPLARLTTATEQVNLENLDQLHLNVGVKRRNEFKILEEGFNAMLQKLRRARSSLEATLSELARANTRLQILLTGTRQLVTCHDKFHAMLFASETLLQGLPPGVGEYVELYFWEQRLQGEEGYVYFQIPIEIDTRGLPKLKLHRIHQIEHHFAEVLPPAIQSAASPCEFQPNQLIMPLIYREKVLGALTIELKASFQWNPEDHGLVTTLAHSLMMTLESINFTLDLERIIYERTKALKDTLQAQEFISESLLKATQELNKSHQSLEQQNLTLLASNRKLEDLNSTKERLLYQLNQLRETHFEQLRQIHQDLLNSLEPEKTDPVRQALRYLQNIDETLQPFSHLYHSEQAIASKRVLLADTDKKQQIVAKMALGGTGVELDFVTDLEEGQRLLESQTYDVLCVNADLIELAAVAHAHSPQTQSVFMTSEDASRYLPILQQYPYLSNIVSRQVEDRTFTVKNILTTVSKLINDDLFGLEKYLNWGVEVQKHAITHSSQRPDLIQAMETYLEQLGIRRVMITKCVMVAEELLMNAIYDAPTDASGKSIYNHLPRTQEVRLKPHEQGAFRYACDGLLLAISTEDPFGAFGRATILKYLKSCYEGQGGTMQTASKKGGAGRGLFQIMETCDLLVFNVKPHVKTEVIAIFNIDPNRSKTDRTTSFHYFYAEPDPVAIGQASPSLS